MAKRRRKFKGKRVSRKKVSIKQGSIRELNEWFNKVQATSIQRLFRGHMGRKKAKALRGFFAKVSNAFSALVSAISNSFSAVTSLLGEFSQKVSNLFQGNGFYTHGQVVQIQKQKEEAATSIQSLFRGHRVREVVKKQKEIRNSSNSPSA